MASTREAPEEQLGGGQRGSASGGRRDRSFSHCPGGRRSLRAEGAEGRGGGMIPTLPILKSQPHGNALDDSERGHGGSDALAGTWGSSSGFRRQRAP